MASFQEFKDGFAALKTGFVTLNEALENVAADVLRIKEQLEAGGLTATQEAELFTELGEIGTSAQATVAKAKEIADSTPEPEPPVEPTSKKK